MRIPCLILSSFLLLIPFTLCATPKNVIIIRHAEKPKEGNCLALQGLERAAALGYFFSGTPLYNNPPPSFVFAALGKKKTSSIRSFQTCTAIAEHLKLPVDSTYTPHKTSEIARAILNNPKYDNATILICWEHQKIDELVEALGGPNPGKWPGDVFDQVYMLTFDEKGHPTFSKQLQKLLYGDSTNFDEKPTPLPAIPVKCPDEKK